MIGLGFPPRRFSQKNVADQIWLVRILCFSLLVQEQRKYECLQANSDIVEQKMWFAASFRLEMASKDVLWLEHPLDTSGIGCCSWPFFLW